MGVELARRDCRKTNRNSAFKIQLQAMFIDTSLNTVPTVLANLHQSFHEAAVRCFEYVRGLSRIRPTHSHLLISKCWPPKPPQREE
jgi:hypothetical protein